MMELTQEQAVQLYNSKFWERLTHEQRARFQLNEERLCMPFGVFHEAVEKTLGRPVYTHEFATRGIDGLRKELNGEKGPPTFEEIVGLLGDKSVIVVAPESRQR